VKGWLPGHQNDKTTFSRANILSRLSRAWRAHQRRVKTLLPPANNEQENAHLQPRPPPKQIQIQFAFPISGASAADEMYFSAFNLEKAVIRIMKKKVSI